MTDRPDDPRERRLDETAAHEPVRDEDGPDATDRDATDHDATAVYGQPPGPAPGGPADRTQQFDQTQRYDDDTRPVHGYGDDTTAALPPTPGEPAWSGRAGVPPAGAPPRGPAPTEWAPVEDPHGGRRWWMPILLGLLALVLLGALALGIWLLTRGDDEPGPSPSPTAAATTAAPTTAPPTTSAPTPTATTAGPVVVPPLFGLTEEQARDQLRAAGLEPSLRFEPSDQREGTVVDADPPPGSQVPAGSTVTLIISTGPTSAPTTSPPLSPPPAD